MQFTHEATAYILRWNKPDYKAIIGVFLLKEHLENFLQAHFTPQEISNTYFDNNPNMIVEQGRYYRPLR